MKKLVLLVISVLLVTLTIGCSPAAKAGTPLVLLTDFGDDYRTARLRGAIYSTGPDVTVIEGTHGIPGMDVAAGAYILDITAQEFPENVIFLTIVGTHSTPEERYLLLLTANGQMFLSPDNGTLTYVIENQEVQAIYSINVTEMLGEEAPGESMHTILGKAGALLASGYAPEDTGPEIDDPVMLDIQKPVMNGGKLQGSIVFVDHFGNCLTNIAEADFARLGLETGDMLRVNFAGTGTEMKYGESYSSVATGQEVALVNSMGILQLSVYYGSFADENGVQAGTKIEIEAP